MLERMCRTCNARVMGADIHCMKCSEKRGKAAVEQRDGVVIESTSIESTKNTQMQTMGLVTNHTMPKLRNILFDELKSLREGKSDANRANAVAKLAAQVVNSVAAEVAFMNAVR